ncbi:polymer-forming cytoskeletal protein [Shewanella sp. M16]|uniref:polymer-forming cytoskeletal protein n=1 Tax=Shewanella sp. M16 TaxID=2830837 RepID=UPI001BAFA11E|nr:polymer-forming cytoskeletal protein [Shewanella sp. M16]MBS0042852.1 polymer-forming cytoskeletal protein [Shewanella sp. M16]
MASKGNGITVISAQTLIEGDIQFESAAFIAGKLQGKIRSAGQIKIELGGEISGEVSCHELRVCGVFRGRVCCNKLIITSSGVVDGEVASHQMEIYEGGQFIGQRIKGPELDALPDMLQALAPIAQRSDAHLYASESTLLRGDNLAIRPWLYVAVATVVIALGFSFGPEQLREWLPNLSDSTLKTEVSPAIEGLKAVNGMAPDQPVTPNSANADNMAVLPADDPDPQIMQQDSAMEDLQQMEQGHEQMTQGDNGAPRASDSATNKL